jgi:3-hydroxyacyl-[acyl-carrier-protein] dehydratase
MTKPSSFPITDPQFIGKLIPQKHPMVMVDSLLEFKNNQITAALTIKKNNIFVANHCFQEGGIIEHIAQSIALYTGYLYFLQDKPAPTGYIGAIKSVTIHGLPQVDSRLITQVQVLQEFGGVTLVTAITHHHERLIATAEMKTVLAS